MFNWQMAALEMKWETVALILPRLGTRLCSVYRKGFRDDELLDRLVKVGCMGKVGSNWKVMREDNGEKCWKGLFEPYR